MKVQSVVRVAVGKYEVRVFLEESVNFQYTQLGVTDMEIVIHRNQDLPMMELAQKLLDNQKVAAVEITSWDQNGVRVER
jgi:hypothetical protein